MHHIGDRADAVQRIEAVKALRDIRHAEGDPVACPDSHCEKRPRTALDPRNELFKTGFSAVEFIRRFLRRSDGNFFDHLKHGQIGIFQMIPLYILFAHDFLPFLIPKPNLTTDH